MVEIVKNFDEATITKIVKVINDGGVVCFPTETVYALAADSSNDEAVKRIYDIKKRDETKPLSLLAGYIDQAKRVVDFCEYAEKIAFKFFPGPITLVLKMKENNTISRFVNPNLGTIGVRIPSHVLSLKIIKAVGRSIVGTSANTSGQGDIVSSNSAKIIETIGDKIDFMIDCGSTEIGTHSTVVDLSSGNIEILREGAVSAAEILAIKKPCMS